MPSSSLQVDSRSRGRSKSPGGRDRDRSRSRDDRDRGVSPSPAELSKKALQKYYAPSDDDSEEDDGLDRRRSASGADYGSSKKKSSRKSKYSESDSEDTDELKERYQRVKERDRDRAAAALGGKSKDRYYHSDSEDEKLRDRLKDREKERRRAAETTALSKTKGRSSKYDSESEDEKYYRSKKSGGRRHGSASSDDSEDDSDLDHLAYGDHRYGSTTSSSRPSKSDSRSSKDPYSKSSSSAYRLNDDDSDRERPGSHPSYAKPERYSYANPAHFIPPTTAAAHYLDGRHTSYGGPQPVMAPDWSHLPEHERHLPGGFPPVSGPPPIDAYVHGAHVGTHPYANPPQWQYAQPDPNIKYASKTAPKHAYTQSDANQYVKPYTQSHDPQYLEIAPGQTRGQRSSSLSVGGATLGVGGLTAGGHGGHGGGRPPASPLLEAYKGTYQSISPMPSPMAAPHGVADDDISDLSDLDGKKVIHVKPRDTKDGHHKSSKKEKEREKDRERRKSSTSQSKHGDRDVVMITPTGRKKVSFYEAKDDAIALKDALSRSSGVDTKPLMTILPYLTSDEILTLRTEYKNHAKVQGKGINIAKHIKMKLGSSAFGKVCYATALGRWESEAYWANCYYQAGTSRRELLIESLIGRSNSDIREIKNCFRDARYSDSLEKCMKAELKADKFRTAVLLALEEHRQPERDVMDIHLVQHDVAELHKALVSREGGETAMINIIVVRSDSHLREVLRVYENLYKQNFARAMISKSKNLVGETLAHILNGAINRPMRDALLLHQAIRESQSGRERSELLISRLVRLHWEPRHLEAVKAEYRRRYGERVEEAIAQEVMTTSGGTEWGEFCIELCRSSAQAR